MANDNNRYTCRWVDLKAENRSPWLGGIESISLPIAHGEGKFYAEPALLKTLNQNKQIALRYAKGEISSAQALSYNPNGSLEDIAGITNRKGNVLGLMPHPERAIFFTQHPHWTAQKETLLRSGQQIPQYAPSLRLFQNAMAYAREEF